MRGHPDKKDLPRPLSIREQLEDAMGKAKKQAGQETPEGKALGILSEALRGVMQEQAPEEPTKRGRPFGKRYSPRTAAFQAWMDHAKPGDQYVDIGDRRAQLNALAREEKVLIAVEACCIVTGPKSNPSVQQVCLVTRVDENADESTRDVGAVEQRDA